MLNCVPGLVSGNSKCGHRRCVVNVGRQTKLLLCRIVMVAEETVRLHNIDIVNLRGLQNLSRAFGAGDVRGSAHFPPAIESTGHADLRPDPENRRNNQVKKEMITAKADWIE